MSEDREQHDPLSARLPLVAAAIVLLVALGMITMPALWGELESVLLAWM